MLNQIIKFFISLAILFVMLHLGEIINQFLPIGISSSIWGMLLLFVCLACGIINIEWIAPSAKLLTRYMTLFFLPICVGIIEHKQLFNDYLSAFFIAIFLSTILSLVVITYFAQWLLNKQVQKKRHNRRKYHNV
ncbi:CidA/LrgA family protein [Phocoenobacter skyensis]|uniref:CidA/LrgA family protein n=1 Tax=Phocoenobacter skyensis TaxID=97481 RepID=A0A1H7XEH3_9PAST|nr:CidA/LrgA family protein [Pasteurella skyensis]MDP8079658.1 CidA/LrgA family protein [Pasteurella skyensis]MDP8085642.1 CidA/LrgA family protein [Pasteurella skyensis]MDP8170589.1 CidA/LrgA family protein [Pasteurella skyensis]MDP8174584.1 CidA/LrgA family protein [Pasteurella skyensis]MDP8176852.1 CidA/LrgA family protein [Pasteurella skyensis]